MPGSLKRATHLALQCDHFDWLVPREPAQKWHNQNDRGLEAPHLKWPDEFYEVHSNARLHAPIEKEAPSPVRSPASQSIHQGVGDLQSGRPLEVHLHRKGGPLRQSSPHQCEPEDLGPGPKRHAKRIGYLIWQACIQEQNYEHEDWHQEASHALNRMLRPG
mgnify:CR=1 FL=1